MTGGWPRTAVTLKMASQLAAILLWFGGSVWGLHEVEVVVPVAVAVGASAKLQCHWALDAGEALYSVKWYRGAQEFFRFIPKELPNTKVFPQTGISVDVSQSGAHQVVLRGATRALSGRYRCEVSADAPFFHTDYKSAYMRVVELPDSSPVVRAQKSWYSTGDLLRANCSAPPADPPANLTWLLNGHQVKGLDIPPQHVPQLTKKQPLVTDASLEDANRIIFSPWEPLGGYEDPVTDNVIDVPGNIDALRYQGISSREESSTRRILYETTSGPANEERSNKTTANSQLVMRVQAGHFHKGRLNVTCVARVLTAYTASAELLLEEERPQLALVMGSRDSNAELSLNIKGESFFVKGDIFSRQDFNIQGRALEPSLFSAVYFGSGQCDDPCV